MSAKLPGATKEPTAKSDAKIEFNPSDPYHLYLRDKFLSKWPKRSPTKDPCWKVAPAEDERMGLGVFATRDIKDREVILEDEPCLAVPVDLTPAQSIEKLRPQFELLSEEMKKTVLSLHRVTVNNFRGSYDISAAVVEIFSRNCVETDHDGYQKLFPKLARFNHSCSPNVLSVGGTVVALRDIGEGEELCWNYCADVDEFLWKTEDDREADLQFFLGKNLISKCHCSACWAFTGDGRERVKVGAEYARISDSVNGIIAAKGQAGRRRNQAKQTLEDITRIRPMITKTGVICTDTMHMIHLCAGICYEEHCVKSDSKAWAQAERQYELAAEVFLLRRGDFRKELGTLLKDCDNPAEGSSLWWLKNFLAKRDKMRSGEGADSKTKGG